MEKITLTKIKYEDLPSETTPIDADNLNNMQENTQKAFDSITEKALEFDDLFEVVDTWE